MYNHEIDTFLEVERTGSFSKASKELYISKAAVAQQITNLERKLDIKLFIRTSHGVRLTDAGEYFSKRVKEIVKLCTQVEKDLENFRPHLIVGAGYLNKQLLLQNILKRIHINQDSVNFKEISDYNHIPADVEIIEMVKSKEPIIKQGFTFIPIKKIPYVLAVPPKMIKKDKIRAQDLNGMTIAIPDNNITGDSTVVEKLRNTCVPIKIKNYRIFNRAQINQCQYRRELLMIPEVLSDLCLPYEIKTINLDLYTEYGFYIRNQKSSLIYKIKNQF